MSEDTKADISVWACILANSGMIDRDETRIYIGERILPSIGTPCYVRLSDNIIIVNSEKNKIY